MSYCIINCTAADKNEALKISKELVKRKLAACCSIIEGITSIYEWKGALHEDIECLIIIKTRTELFDKVKAAILELHSYETPEIIAQPVTAGDENYMKWIDEQTGV